MSARDNAKRKAQNVHGIAAAFGSANDTFRKAIFQNSGAEMQAMEKTANDNPKNNPKQEQNSDKVLQYRNSSTTSSPTMTKTRPSDTPYPTTAKPSSATEAVNSFNYSPLEKKAVNDYPSKNPEQIQKNNNTNKEAQSPTEINRSNVIRGAFGKESEVPTVQNALDKEAEVMVGKNISDSFKNLSTVKRRETENENSSIQAKENRPSAEGIEYIPTQEINPGGVSEFLKESEISEKIEKIIRLARTEKIYLNKEDARQLLESDFRVKFPIAMFSFAILSDLADIFLALYAFGIMGLSAVLNATFIGAFVGVPLAVASAAIFLLQIIFNISHFVINFLWVNHYSKNAADFTKRISFMRRFIYSKMLTKIYTRLWMKLIPGINLAPIKSSLIYLVYRDMVKMSTKLERIIN